MSVTFGGSLGPLLNPRYELRGDTLLLWIDVPDAAGGPPFDGLPSRHPLTPYQTERCTRDPRFLASTLRTALLRALEHELDESIMLDGRQAFPPKHWGPEEP